MKILIACEDFRVGGAQVFALRLASALSAEHKVWLYSHYDNYIDKKLTKRNAPDIDVLFAHFKADWLIRKFDRLLYLIRVDFSWRERFIAKHIKQVVTQYGIELVHSHMFKSDYVIAKALRGLSLPLVTTMHGNYEGFLKNYSENTGEIILNYPKKLLDTLVETDAIAYLTDKNLRVFEEEDIVPAQYHQHIVTRKIYNGFMGHVDKPRHREELGIEDNKLVFGLVARGIPEKGWEVTIEAFNLLPEDTAHLVLVGWSDYVADLSRLYAENKNIHFVGYSDNPLDWIQLFDVGLLPSVYGESLPNVIVEYMYCGKSTIVSDIGESKLMIEVDGQHAGFVVPVENNKVDVEKLSNSMRCYIEDQELLSRYQSLALKAFQKFEMDSCIQKYTKLYQLAHERKIAVGVDNYASV